MIEICRFLTPVKSEVNLIKTEETSAKEASSDDLVDGLIRHDWSSGELPPQIMQFGAPIVRVNQNQHNTNTIAILKPMY